MHCPPVNTLTSTTIAEAGSGWMSSRRPYSASDVAPSVRSMVCRLALHRCGLLSRMWSWGLHAQDNYLLRLL